MKKRSIFLWLIFGGFVLVGCNGQNKEKEREDSIRRADSVAAVQAEQEAEAALKAAEAARLDSIRQDSIAKIPVITPSMILKKGEYGMTYKKNIGKILEGEGFVLTEKKNITTELGTDGETYGKAEKCFYEKNGVNIKVVTIKEPGYGEDPEVEITFPSKESATTFVEAAKKLGYKKAYGDTYLPTDDMSILSMNVEGSKVTFIYAP